MRPISSRVHGILDYLSGLLFIASPWLFGFANGEFAQWIPIIIGATILVMSLITDYEFSLAKLVPLPVHLSIDILGGALLASSPWLFGFAEWVYWPHLLLGIAEIGAGLLTRKVPDYRVSVASPRDSNQRNASADTTSSYQQGDVIEMPDGRASTKEQRHMTNEEELKTHVREKEEQRAADAGRSRTTRSASHKPHQRD